MKQKRWIELSDAQIVRLVEALHAFKGDATFAALTALIEQAKQIKVR